MPELPTISEPRQVIADYRSTGLSLRRHPMSFIRESLDRRRVTRNIELHDEKRWPGGKWISVSGVVLIRQRPGTAQGIIFETIEDETGVANLILRPKVYEQYRKAALHATAVQVDGQVERQGLVVHVMVHRMRDISHQLTDLTSRSRDFH